MLTATPRGRDNIILDGQAEAVNAAVISDKQKRRGIMQANSPRSESRNLPRRYRPPAAKRRKKKTVAYQFDQAPPPEDGVAAGVPAEEAAEDITYEPEEEESAAPELRRRSAAKHITRDYSYVRSEIVRILVLAGFLVTSLIITAILRN